MSNDELEMIEKLKELTDPENPEFSSNLLEAMAIGEPGVQSIFMLRQAIHRGQIPEDTTDYHDRVMDKHVGVFYNKLEKTVLLLIENYVKGLIQINEHCTCIQCKRNQAQYN
jgi:hypothetical protein